MVDTNSDPREVEYVIPSNDDASKSIDKILTLVTAAIIDGLANRNSDATPEENATEATAETPEAVVAEAIAPAVEEEAIVAEAAVVTEVVETKTEE
jgi:small subunit ribosomal protein S2